IPAALIRCASIVLALLLASSSWAQEKVPAPQGPLDQKTTNRIVTVNGEIGFLGELYSISGRDNRRPGDLARISLRSTITAWNSLSMSFNAMLSSEGSSARQDINQIDLNPKWRWGEAHVGDFTHEFSSLTLSGIRIRGGGVMITPGKWRLSLLSGLTHRSVSTNDNNRSYERLVTGGKIGFGRSEGSFFELLAFTARDKLEVLASAPVDTAETPDTSVFDVEQAPAAVTPQENLVISTVTNLALFSKKLKWRTEIAGCAITRDRRSSELDASDVPEFLTNIFKPRVSSSADYAYRTEMDLGLSRVTVNAGYEYVGPGYISLGLASQTNDRREFSGGVMWRHRSGTVRFDGAIQSDNLIHQKLFTTDRVRLTGTTTYQISRQWRSNLIVTFTGAGNDASSNTMLTDYRSWVIRTGHNVMFARQYGLKNLTFDYTLQTAGDKNPARSSAEIKTHSSTVGGTFVVRENLEMVSTVGLVSSRMGSAGRALTQTYSISVRLASLRSKLMTSGTVVATIGETSSTLRPGIKSSYQIGPRFTAGCEIESTLGRADSDMQGGDFDEFTARFSLTHRF
ncbi:MAG: hypothetical protein NTW07_02875, partial [candidate division Zixibacteria bacterium]|nr:hypothetical protein [candidate division Zixibacteria bacterium]